ncbi:hypothetical protein ACFPK1_02415 [Actinomycetospora rhizophila]|uniref:Uncharacterized protein n=1 Tax=Actinomycetospora rhizophila TaxID=1416876 RepID=A0ABV9Z946_9PSEU
MTSLRLRVGAGAELLGDLHYVRDEYSFDFQPSDGDVLARRCPAGTTSLLVQNLQLEVGLPEQSLMFAWGLHPQTIWSESRLEPPAARPGVVEVVWPDDLSLGTSVAVDDRFAWGTTWDPVRRWLRIAPSSVDDGTAVEIATGVIVVVSGDQLRSVWLNPAIVDTRAS